MPRLVHTSSLICGSLNDPANEAALKYKQYNKTRDILSGKIPPPSERPKSEKRQSNDVPVQTPSKRQKHLATPSKSRNASLDATPSKSLPPLYDDANTTTPSIARHLFSPAAPRSIGPTPQRDGRVMGLFDLMSERELGTPSRANGASQTANAPLSLFATPSKRSAANLEAATTPNSSGKKRKTDGFVTPLKLKNMNANGDKTPSSSTLRKVEEEAHDDDMDALREMEQGETGLVAAPAPMQMKPPPKPQDDVLVADSQVMNLPLGGFDDEGMYDTEPEEQLGRDGQPLKVYKKKGQKRTTRRSNMKPVHHKRPTASVDGAPAEDDDVVPETQMNPNKENEYASGDEADFVPSDVEGSDAEAAKAKSSKKTVKKTNVKEGAVKKTARKVNEFAHTNFRRLKLRNTGSKGGAGFNSKFRRRR
ncbi:DNA replication regulator SLD2 [Verticillium alfalfae VaMs.102]|uniref:DNA replication regulator SLD2 n=1 Tax=Verticillium alfalfae (strain VaMs.102 / ATCC MYA-4576 / FGSC 10136) TaxID=526221 RepID=C9SGF5_VERA1|nr:DNA replication regulator SLD2 [Verticillium alfalfae VaMs.102]EEY17495.1 DNA replication regulator SLD2 [Verticillium alfalfae VaMs.102]